MNTKIWVGIQFEGAAEAEELFSCIEEALVVFRNKKLAFATTAEDQPIEIVGWNPEWVAE